MRLSPERVQQALDQFEAQVIPDSHPAMAQLTELYGDHTFFLAANGLNIVEPLGASEAGVETAAVVNLASWTDASAVSLRLHEPKATNVIVELVSEDPDLAS